MKETYNGDGHKWKNILCSWTGRINTTKMTILLKTVCRFSAIPIKIPMTFFTELEKRILKSIWQHTGPQVAKTVLRKNSRAGGSRFTDFSNQNSMILAQNRHLDPWNRIKSPEINLLTCSVNPWQRKQGYTKGGNDSFISKCRWENRTAPCKRIRCTTFSHHLQK